MRAVVCRLRWLSVENPQQQLQLGHLQGANVAESLTTTHVAVWYRMVGLLLHLLLWWYAASNWTV